jgi:hypothetical protein
MAGAFMQKPVLYFPRITTRIAGCVPWSMIYIHSLISSQKLSVKIAIPFSMVSNRKEITALKENPI